MPESVAARTICELVQTLLVENGGGSAASLSVAFALVSAELSGHRSHGLRLLPDYVGALRAGVVTSPGDPLVVDAGKHHLVVDAEGSFGDFAIQRAVESAIEHSRVAGLCTVSLRNLSYVSRLAPHLYAAAALGQVGFLTLGAGGIETKGFVAPFGGSGRWLDTNPMAFGFPSTPRPIVVDLATSATTYNEVRRQMELGNSLPPGMACDAEGSATVSPQATLDGGWLLSAGPKAFALSLVAPLMAALHPDADECAGGFMVMIDVDSRLGLHSYQDKTSMLVSTLRGCVPGGGVNLRIPGDGGYGYGFAGDLAGEILLEGPISALLAASPAVTACRG